MERRLILRGLLAGAFGGLLAFVFASILAEPLIDDAIAYEQGRAQAQDALDRAAGFEVAAEAGEPLVSRAVQATAGLGAGMLAFGLAMGGLYAVAYTLCLGRTGRVRARPLALLVAAAGFVTVFAVPFLKYPANPPAVGSDGTIRDRAGLFLALLVVSVLAAVLATWGGQRLRPRFGTWNAALLAGGGFVVVVAAAMLALPPLGDLPQNAGSAASETPLPLRGPDGAIAFPGFPADVLAEFRLYSIGAHLLLWTAIAVVFAPLADRVLSEGARPAVAPPPRAAEPVGS